MSIFSARLIRRLDFGLRKAGEDIVLQRLVTDEFGTQSVAFEAPCRAKVRAHLPQQLDHVAYEAPVTRITISPNSLTRAGWPGLPARDDRVLIDGQPSNVETVSPIRINGALVRINLTCLAFQ